MSAATTAFAFSQSLEDANVRKSLNPANANAKADAKVGLKALALKTLQGAKMRNTVRNMRETPCENACENRAVFAQANAKNPGLPWPDPEAFPLVVRSVPWKYACLFAIASVYGAALTREAGGELTLTCPATMPQEAAQAARDGLAELAGYIGGRLQ